MARAYLSTKISGQAILAAFASTLLSATAKGQAVAPAPLTIAPAGGELERYLRVEQLAGRVPLRPWAVRGFGPRELAAMRDSAGPWARSERAKLRHFGQFDWSALPVEAAAIVNTGFPYGMNDGPVWAGRGVTTSLQGGVALRRGPVTAAFSPIAFISQNAPTSLRAVGGSGSNPYSNATSPITIDIPQQFGSGAYARLDPGDSFIRADLGFATAGISTASQLFGPGVEHPIILGNNAGGFPHFFLGSSHPLDLKLVRIHGRLVWGQLSQSSYAPVSVYQGPDDVTRRFAATGVGSLTIPWVPGLELGAIRFFHAAWPSGGAGDLPFLRIFEGILKRSVSTSSNPSGDVATDNQLASLFARWAFPKSGFEAYLEYGREDHSQNLRDLWEEPDHAAAFLIGLQRIWKRSDDATVVFRAEQLNTRISHLVSVAKQTPWYEHGILAQGHTQRGQALGSVGGHGGGATTIALDRYSPRGRTTWRWDRTMRGELRGEGNLPLPAAADVLHAFSAERLRFTRRGDIGMSASAILDLNRNFGGDAFEARAAVWFRLIPR